MKSRSPPTFNLNLPQVDCYLHLLILLYLLDHDGSSTIECAEDLMKKLVVQESTTLILNHIFPVDPFETYLAPCNLHLQKDILVAALLNSYLVHRTVGAWITSPPAVTTITCARTRRPETSTRSAACSTRVSGRRR